MMKLRFELEAKPHETLLARVMNQAKPSQWLCCGWMHTEVRPYWEMSGDAGIAVPFGIRSGALFSRAESV
jgi:hypothetical protein